MRFGTEHARRLRRTRGTYSNIWHLDELCLVINGERGWLWRAVDDAGEVLDGMVPCAIVTDRLASYAAAKIVAMPSVTHLRGWRQNNRVENSHQPVRQHERRLQRFKALRHAARFCSVSSTVCNQFRPGRHALSAPNYRTVMWGRWREWDSVAETTAFAAA